MKTYNCEVRLGGNMLHTVPKFSVTQKEVALLRHIHGSDSITALVEAGEKDVENDQEYLRLAREYGPKAVKKCFDVNLDNFDSWLQDQLYTEEEARESRENSRIVAASVPKQTEQAAA